MPGGRPKGSKNRAGSAVKDNILRVFEDMGGRPSMVRWANSNQDEFYKMYGRLAPKEVIADVDADLTIQLVSYVDHDTDTED